jgi:hypothetical protein
MGNERHLLQSSAAKRDRVDKRVEIERRQVGVISANVNVLAGVVRKEVNRPWEGIIEMWEGDF